MALVRVGSGAAPDLVQETLTLALDNLRRGRWRGEGSLASYLAAILRHLVARSQRSGGRESAVADLDGLPAPEGDPLAATRRFEQQRQVRRALQRLSTEHLEVVLRHYFDEQSVGQIARDLGVPRGTVLSRLHYARKKIVRHLNQQASQGHCMTGKARAG
jgi:RNA polymerase sigma-70 factor (ECF subfamily)